MVVPQTLFMLSVKVHCLVSSLPAKFCKSFRVPEYPHLLMRLRQDQCSDHLVSGRYHKRSSDMDWSWLRYSRSHNAACIGIRFLPGYFFPWLAW
jgi:hypothetical protein